MLRERRCPPRSNIALRSLSFPENLLLERIVSEQEYAALDNVSIDTVRRRSARGEGARRIQLSPKRFGYRLRDILAGRQQTQELS